MLLDTYDEYKIQKMYNFLTESKAMNPIENFDPQKNYQRVAQKLLDLEDEKGEMPSVAVSYARRLKDRVLDNLRL